MRAGKTMLRKHHVTNDQVDFPKRRYGELGRTKQHYLSISPGAADPHSSRVPFRGESRGPFSCFT